MKKIKLLLQKDGFYLALFVCICLVAVGGIWFTKNSVDDLAAKNGFLEDGKEVAKGDEEDEVQLIEKEDESVPTSTDSKENLEQAKAKEKETSKMDYLGEKVIREYSEKDPSYSTTLDVWEIHKGLDISAKQGSKVKSLLSGKVVDVFNDDQHGISIKIESEDKVVVTYANLDEKTSVKKGQELKEGDVIGKVGNTTSVESLDDSHIHLTATKDGKSIDPMNLIK
ncbi:MAG: peptidoglycan DD-metalloendopeptidase family protein [Paraclostridium sp.]